jgi:hypothetical protein
VYLLNEGTDAWRPVRAERLRGDIYRISEQPYDEEQERWQFPPGSVVRVRETTFDGGRSGLVACEQVPL